jgi:hypothetical protein
MKPERNVTPGRVAGAPYFRVIFAGDNAPIDVTTQACFIAVLDDSGTILTVTRAPSLIHLGALLKAAVVHAIEHNVIGSIFRTIMNPAEGTRSFGARPNSGQLPPDHPRGEG